MVTQPPWCACASRSSGKPPTGCNAGRCRTREAAGFRGLSSGCGGHSGGRRRETAPAASAHHGTSGGAEGPGGEIRPASTCASHRHLGGQRRPRTPSSSTIGQRLERREWPPSHSPLRSIVSPSYGIRASCQAEWRAAAVRIEDQQHVAILVDHLRAVGGVFDHPAGRAARVDVSGG